VTGRRDAVRGDRRRSGTEVGKSPNDDTPRRGRGAAAQSGRLSADVRGPVDYKRAMVAELTVRILRRAVERALSFNG
jgi:CO/xanthine dehydrogenase FAD-binding subunit